LGLKPSKAFCSGTSFPSVIIPIPGSQY
jgi:hypothetical protein